MKSCPHCQGTGYVRPESQAERLADAWRKYCLDSNIFLSSDGQERVREDTAAELLELSAGYLRNLRSWGVGPAFVRGSRISYRLFDLARFKLEREK